MLQVAGNKLLGTCKISLLQRFVYLVTLLTLCFKHTTTAFEAITNVPN